MSYIWTVFIRTLKEKFQGWNFTFFFSFMYGDTWTISCKRFLHQGWQFTMGTFAKGGRFKVPKNGTSSALKKEWIPKTLRNTPQNGWVDIWFMRFHFWASIRPFFENHVFRAVSETFYPLKRPETSKNPLRHNFDGKIPNPFVMALVMYYYILCQPPPKIFWLLCILEHQWSAICNMDNFVLIKLSMS